jgi:hypothetical protein
MSGSEKSTYTLINLINKYRNHQANLKDNLDLKTLLEQW